MRVRPSRAWHESAPLWYTVGCPCPGSTGRRCPQPRTGVLRQHNSGSPSLRRADAEVVHVQGQRVETLVEALRAPDRRGGLAEIPRQLSRHRSRIPLHPGGCPTNADGAAVYARLRPMSGGSHASLDAQPVILGAAMPGARQTHRQAVLPARPSAEAWAHSARTLPLVLRLVRDNEGTRVLTAHAGDVPP